LSDDGPVTSPAVIGALAIGYFPPEEWALAVERWPDLVEEMPLEHRAYCEAIEARTKRLASRLVGQRFAVTPLTVEALDARTAEEEGRDEAGNNPAQIRSIVAADQWRRGIGTPWPPGRNDRCWCGSGRKYKQCCGPVAAAPFTPSD
jgi:uncharacterized protein YecA (UPF0149 family)